MYSKEPSFWEKSVFLDNIDIAIIGAGLVGTSAAIYAKSLFKDARVLVLDRGFISSGASTKNAGFACFGSISELLDDLETSTETEVFSLVQKRFEGLQNLLSLVGEDQLEYKPYGGHELFSENEKELANECIDKVGFFNKALKQITGKEETYSLNDSLIKQQGLKDIMHCITNQSEGQLNPGKMMQKLYQKAKSIGVVFYNGILVEGFEEDRINVNLQLSNGWNLKGGKSNCS